MSFNGYFSRHGESNFPIPSSGEPYVYLKSLAQHPGIASRVRKIANAKLNAYTNNLSTHGMENSLSFLKSAAAICRSHELNFIEAKAKELESLGFLGSEE